MKQKVYIETTVVSYLTARLSHDPITAGRQKLTQEWWKRRRPCFHIVVSELVFQEAREGDARAAKRRVDHITGTDSLIISDEAISLGEALIIDGPIPEEYGEDALHIALCAVNGIDYLLTWNCKHLANAILRRKIEKVVEVHGYQSPIICTPAELMEE